MHARHPHCKSSLPSPSLSPTPTQNYQKAKWTRTFEIQEETHWRTAFFGYLRSVVLLLVGVTQVFTIRLFFTVGPSGRPAPGVGFRASAYGRKNPSFFS